MIDKNILAKYQSMDCYKHHEPINHYTSHFYDDDTPLHWAAFCGNVQDLEVMLQNIGLKDIDIKGDIGNTPLLNAISGKKYNCVELLLKYGADPYQENDYGDNAFDWGDTETLTILAKFGFPNNRPL